MVKPNKVKLEIFPNTFLHALCENLQQILKNAEKSCDQGHTTIMMRQFPICLLVTTWAPVPKSDQTTLIMARLDDAGLWFCCSWQL